MHKHKAKQHTHRVEEGQHACDDVHEYVVATLLTCLLQHLRTGQGMKEHPLSETDGSKRKEIGFCSTAARSIILAEQGHTDTDSAKHTCRSKLMSVRMAEPRHRDPSDGPRACPRERSAREPC